MISLTKIMRVTKMCRKSSVVRKSRKPRNVDNFSRHYRQQLVNLLALRNIKTHNLPEMLTPLQSSDDDASSLIAVEICAPIHHVTTKRSPINRLKLTEARSRFGSRRMTRKFSRAVAPVPILDLTTIQERHQYNAQYERVYDEYYQVQQRIEKIQRDYLLFTHRLQRVPQDSTVYEHLKEHIESEYQRKNSEETNKSQYLYNKLLHIQKLVTGYDASPTSKPATERLAAAARDYLHRYQPSANFRSAAEFDFMRPEHENLCNTLQFPMFRLTVDNLKIHDKQQELAEIQLNYLDINSIPYNVWNVVPESRMDIADSSNGEYTDITSTYSESENKDPMGRGSVVNNSIHSESVDESSQGYSSYGSRDRNTSHRE